MQKAKKDKRYMLRAITLAKRGLGKTSPNPAVGCVIVKDNRIVGEGFHRRFGLDHAETEALKRAGAKAKGARLYVTLEPCTHFGKTPPCTDAIIKAGIKEVIAAMRDPNPINNGKGIRILRAVGIRVKEGICKKEAEALNAPFVKYMKKGMPYVTLKLAQSLDGKITTRTGDSKWISNEASRRLVHQWRSLVDAVMVGVDTVIRDDPLLTARTEDRQPVKIVVDSKLRAPLNAKIFSNKSPAKTIIATTSLAPKNRIKRILRKNAEVLFAGSKNGKVGLKALMRILAEKGIINIMIEGGSSLAASALGEGIVDKVLFFIAPKIIADKNEVKEALKVKGLTVKRIGSDFLLEGRL